MNYRKTWIAIAALGAASLVTGCQPPPAKVTPPPPVDTSVPESRTAATAQLADHVTRFNDAVGQMPGDSGLAHRKLLVDALGELSQILQLVNGPDMSPEFANNLSVIDAAEKTASNPSLPRARMEAVENDAIHAADKAFAEISSRVLFDDAQLPPMVDALTAKADAAAYTFGPMHDLDATDCFRLIGNLVQRVDADMNERFGNGAAAGGEQAPPAPTTAPATTP